LGVGSSNRKSQWQARILYQGKVRGCMEGLIGVVVFWGASLGVQGCVTWLSGREAAADRQLFKTGNLKAHCSHQPKLIPAHNRTHPPLKT